MRPVLLGLAVALLVAACGGESRGDATDRTLRDGPSPAEGAGPDPESSRRRWFSLPGGTFADDVAVMGRTLFVPDPGDGALFMVDLDTGEVETIGDIGAELGGIEVWRDRLWIHAGDDAGSDSERASIIELDPANGAVAGEFEVDAPPGDTLGSSPDALVVDGSGAFAEEYHFYDADGTRLGSLSVDLRVVDGEEDWQAAADELWIRGSDAIYRVATSTGEVNRYGFANGAPLHSILLTDDAVWYVDDTLEQIVRLDRADPSRPVTVEGARPFRVLEATPDGIVAATSDEMYLVDTEIDEIVSSLDLRHTPSEVVYHDGEIISVSFQDVEIVPLAELAAGFPVD